MRSRTGNIIGKKVSSTDSYVGIWDNKEQITERRINNWIDKPILLVVKKAYTASTTTATFDFTTTFGGGNVSFTGHATYQNGTTWGPHQLHDNTRTGNDWCNLDNTSPLFGEWSFPKNVIVKSIFVVPRSGGDNFPTFVRVKAGGSSGTEVANNSTLETLTAGVTGHEINYTGSGYNVSLSNNTRNSVWRLEFGGTTSYIGEIEFWGYV